MAEPIGKYMKLSVAERSKKTSRRLWLLLVGLCAIWSGLILAAPVAAAADASTGAQNLYSFFSYICHQMPSRSFHLLGHKMGVCSRCSGVYFGLLIGALLYPVFRNIHEVNPLPRVWLLVAMIPIGLDWGLAFLGVWENTFFTRVVTGLILGVACSIYIVPALAELAEIYSLRRNRATA